TSGINVGNKQYSKSTVQTARKVLRNSGVTVARSDAGHVRWRTSFKIGWLASHNTKFPFMKECSSQSSTLHSGKTTSGKIAAGSGSPSRYPFPSERIANHLSTAFSRRSLRDKLHSSHSPPACGIFTGTSL